MTRNPGPKLLLLLGAALIGPLLSSAPLRAEGVAIEPERTVNVVWFPDEPYAMDIKGVPTGLEIDLWRMIAETRRIPYRISQSPSFEALLAAVESGEADIAIGGILINENRSKKFRYTFPTATSEFRIYTLARGESPGLRLLLILTANEVMMILLGLALMTCVFTMPVWALEWQRPGLPAKKHQRFIYFLQKTLLLSTDHTHTSVSRLISIASLFARVLLTAYFAAYILSIAAGERDLTRRTELIEINQSTLNQYRFGVLKDSVQASILKSNKARILECSLTEECLNLLNKGKVDVLLSDSQTIEVLQSSVPVNMRLKTASGSLMTLFMAFGASNEFAMDQRFQGINDAIARSYYDGTYSKLRQSWLND
jgi:polar amino acid transport system substrate-binding protein